MTLESSPRQRKTRQGDAVVTALSGSTNFRSAQDVYAQLRSEGSKVGLSTVYRHLQTLSDAGAVDVILTADGETNYRLCSDSVDGSHHHHLVCRSCGHTVEVEGKPSSGGRRTPPAKTGSPRSRTPSRSSVCVSVVPPRQMLLRQCGASSAVQAMVLRRCR